MRLRGWYSLTAVLACTLLAYLPSLGNGFTNWDDPAYVTNNPLLRASSLPTILFTPLYGNFSPLTTLSLVLDYRLGGVAPFGYHALNLLLHLLNTALVFLFVRVL